MATKLYSDDVTIIDAKLDVSNYSALKFDSDKEFNDFFEIDRVANWIKKENFKRTALQLPDAFLKFAYRLSSTIESQCVETKIYVLADTSYRSCCIDDVTAQHAKCDSLVHFGESCLSKTTERIPIIYVFGRLPIDIEVFDKHFEKYLEKADIVDTVICLLCDSTFSHCQEQLAETIERRTNSSVISFNLASEESNNIVLGRRISENFETMLKTSKALLIFVGAQNSKLLPIWLMTFPFISDYVHYIPGNNVIASESSKSNRLLLKRLFLIEKLRDANVVGLVVGTLEIKGYVEAIQRVRQLCKAASKKLYVLSIGKLNEAKLSNFASDIDAFIMLSCPFGIVLDSTDFYKPIVSMFEAEIALNSSKEWFESVGWTSEFSNFIGDDVKVADLDKTDVSLITGKLRGTQIVEDDKCNQNRQVITYSAGDYFVNRSWKGLDDGYKQDDSLEIKEGRSGTSMGYASEKSNNVNSC